MNKSKSSLPGSLGILILAAGRGTRMKSSLPKVLHPIAGLPMIAHLLMTAGSINAREISLVVGHGGELVEKEVSSRSGDWGIKRPVRFIKQKILKGSGRAVQESLAFVKRFKTVMILCGDSPLLKGKTLSGMLKLYKSRGVQCVVLTAELPDPGSYGRIMRANGGEVAAIVEKSELGKVSKASECFLTDEVNSGTYVFEASFLIKALKKLAAKGPKREFYLTDVVGLIRDEGGTVLPYLSPDRDEILGINSRVQLARAQAHVNFRILQRLMTGGVTVIDPFNTYVDFGVRIGADSVIYPGTYITGKTTIGRETKIGPSAFLEDCRVGSGVWIKSGCHLSSSRILDGSVIGPFSHLRPGCLIGPNSKIGNFTEVKASRVGRGSKVPHLSYIGDTDMGERVNIGAGTITCNYDGVKKHKTVIGAGTFVGSNVNFVAPVKIGRKTVIGAGSTITDDIPDGMLAIARARQIIKPLKRKR